MARDAARPRRARIALSAGAACAVSAPAWAGEIRCWYEHGVVVAPAVVAGIAGDYILDTGAEHTLLHETRVQTAGFEGTALSAEVRIAGLDLPAVPVAVADLDARTGDFPTPIAGVIGADVLSGRVVDVDLSPCRVRISAPGRAPRFGAAVALPFLAPGLPVVAAGVSDGPHAWRGAFLASTGADAPIRLSTGRASVPGAKAAEDVFPDHGGRAELRAVSLAGDLFERPRGGLTPDAPAGADGVLGAAVLERWRLRFDFARDRLLLAQRKGPPARADGP